MKKNHLSTFRIAYLNLKHSLTKTVGLVFLITVLSFVFFGGTVLAVSLQNGLKNMKDRMGADIMIVPVENDSDMEAILLKGEPSCFYFKKSLEQKVKGVAGVGRATSQFFLTSLDAECCDSRVQLIGFDPDTDFSVTPWIAKVYDKELGEGAVIIGSDIHVDDGDAIKLFGEEYPIAAKLDATGTGLDQAVYSTVDTIKHMYEAAYSKGQRFLEDADPENAISTILIRLEDGYSPSETIKSIRKELGAVQIIESQSMIRNTADNMKHISGFLYVFEVLFIVIVFITVAMVFSLNTNERKKEFAVMRTLGADRFKVVKIVLLEAILIGLAGGVLGVALATGVVFPLQIFIGDSLAMPYITPAPATLFLLVVVSLALSGILAAVSASLSAYKISRAEVYLTMREGE